MSALLSPAGRPQDEYDPGDAAGPLPLAGLKVLDFSRVLAGPLCTQLLGELGADVIKIESIDLGDETRGWPPFQAQGFGTVFLAVNRNKRSLAIDLKSPEGRAIIHKMAASCDIAVENFSTGVAERLGIDAATLRGINDRLIYCSISGFGRTGPLRNAAGYDVILQAFSGMMSLTGEPGGGHIRIPISPIDQVAGLNAHTAILAAIIRRGITGSGASIHVSLLETAISLLNHPLQSFWQRGVQPEKHGSSHESLCPYEVFEASDGAVMIGIANNKLWRKFCVAADLPAMLDDARFSTNAGRADHRQEVLSAVRAKVAERTVAEWVDLLGPLGLPVSPINNLQQMVDHPQVVQTGVILDYTLGDGTPLKGVAPPFNIDNSTRGVRRPPPRRGEQTRELLAEFGIAKSEVDALISSGVLATAED
ncbi:CoA transferase [Novosphingobium indicum]|uniref:CoA transferase n=1 Tax=Novosphingobium indicum TaxID=462949 RepID=A0ABQ2K0V0_9SPHN|nr:CoA transferase [Novosphingobium indicum]GGN61690.1 CoA transferase [Novosphingobium indicum]